MSYYMNITSFKLLKIVDMCLWNICDDVFSPKGNRNHPYHHYSVWNIVGLYDSLSKSEYQYPFYKLDFEKNFVYLIQIKNHLVLVECSALSVGPYSVHILYSQLNTFLNNYGYFTKPRDRICYWIYYPSIF